MAQTSAGAGPIPPAKKDDSEDVAWALSTAEAMYARGDRGDALKWLRRAAEAASEGDADDRALELAKAAADLATSIGPSTPPVAPAAPPQRPPAPVPQAAPSRPGPPPPPPPSPPQPAPAARAVPPARPSPPVRPVLQPQRMVTRAAVPFEPTGTRPTEARRAARRSRPEIQLSRPQDEVTSSMPAHPLEPRRRRSRPPIEETTPPVPVVMPPPPPTPMPETPRSDQLPAAARVEEMDAWPTQSLMGDDLGDPPDEKTRIGVPAYEASARLATEASLAAPLQDPALRPAQALRVVVWRGADGVRVAPVGTRVGAITVEAVLVALDPAADLAAWLSGK